MCDEANDVNTAHAHNSSMGCLNTGGGREESRVLIVTGVVPYFTQVIQTCWDKGTSGLKPSFAWPPECIYDTQFQNKKNCTYKLMKALLFHEFKNI